MTGEEPSLTAQRAAALGGDASALSWPWAAVMWRSVAMARGATQYIVLGAGLDSRIDSLQAAAGLAHLVQRQCV
jgi:hypothetical protein